MTHKMPEQKITFLAARFVRMMSIFVISGIFKFYNMQLLFGIENPNKCNWNHITII